MKFRRENQIQWWIISIISIHPFIHQLHPLKFRSSPPKKDDDLEEFVPFLGATQQVGGGKCRHLHPSIPGSDYRSNLGRFGESLASQEATLAQGALGILPKQPASFTKNTWGVSIRRVVARGPRQKGQNQLVLVVWVSFLGCGILIFSEPTWRKINNFFPGDSRSEKFASRFFFFLHFSDVSDSSQRLAQNNLVLKPNLNCPDLPRMMWGDESRGWWWDLFFQTSLFQSWGSTMIKETQEKHLNEVLLCLPSQEKLRRTIAHEFKAFQGHTIVIPFFPQQKTFSEPATFQVTALFSE